MRWWKRRLASEYSFRRSRTSPSSNVENSSRRLPISSSLARSQSSRAAMLSSAAQARIISMISALLLRTIRTPRRGSTRTRPSCWSRAERLAHGRAADAERGGEPLLVQPQVGVGAVDVHREDRLAQRLVGQLGDARARPRTGATTSEPVRPFALADVAAARCPMTLILLWDTRYQVPAHVNPDARGKQSRRPDGS